MHIQIIKNSLVSANLAIKDKKKHKLKLNKVLTNYNLLTNICKGDISVKDVNETPTPKVQELADQYDKIPKKGKIFFKDVKATYPEIADNLKKEVFKGKESISVDEIIKMIDEIESDDKFWISFDKWEGAQKDLSQHQVVVQLNMDQKLMNEIESNPTVLDFIDRFYKASSGQHPAHGQTLAWTRLYKFPDKWIIEEIQSDLLSADIKVSDKLNSLISKFDDTQLGEIAKFLEKHFTDWDKKLVGTVIELARSEGIKEIWIFDEDYKKKYTQSQSKLKRYYKTVPRDLGFKRDTLRIENKEIPAWKRPVAKGRTKLKAKTKNTTALITTHVDLPLQDIKKLLRFVYKAILTDLGRMDSHTWFIFNMALNKMTDEELKQEWKAITDGTVSDIIQSLMTEENPQTQHNIMLLFDDMTKKYFNEHIGEDKEKLEKAHKQIREYFKMLKQKPPKQMLH